MVKAGEDPQDIFYGNTRDEMRSFSRPYVTNFDIICVAGRVFMESADLFCISKISAAIICKKTHSIAPKNTMSYYRKAQVMLYTRQSWEH